MPRISSRPSEKNEEKESIFSVTSRITTLMNSNHFFIHLAIIIELEKGIEYRLLVIHPNGVILDKIYPSIRGAKIAFSKYFSIRHYKYVEDGRPENPGILAKWSRFYMPEKNILTTKDNWGWPGDK